MDEIFPFEYVGGGYFRRKKVQKGVAAEMLHGQEVPQYIEKELIKRKMILNTNNEVINEQKRNNGKP